jgi:hypothetical protein
MSTHRMTIEDDDGRDVTFACHEAGCGRRVVFRRSGGMVVLNRGDFSALHSGGTLGLHVDADLHGSA